MFTRPQNWNELGIAERREARFKSWSSTEGKPFATPEAESTYRRRTKRVVDIINLKKPDRVPSLPFIGAFFTSYTGTTVHDAMYDYEKYAQAYTKYFRDFKPDYLLFGAVSNPGRAFDLLDYKVYSWPGHGLPKTGYGFQALEGEYMSPDQYDQLIADPELFYFRTYMPRAFGALAPWQMLPSFYLTCELPFTPAFLVPFGIPEIQKTFQTLMEAGKEALCWAMAMEQTDVNLRAELGAPRLPGGISKAPFDIIGDTLRGTRGIMLDMHRHPEKLLAACERLIPIAVQMGVETATVQDNPFVFIPLHKGADGFMSTPNFKKFYWPSYKAVLLGLIKEGLVPYQFVEGGYNERLDAITDPDIPAGSTFWMFDRTDMVQVKKKLGGWACFGGNVPASMLYTSTAQELEAYIRKLIDEVGQDGGFALTTGSVVDHAKPENLHALFETCRRYGVYK